jgi:hypothetical protein
MVARAPLSDACLAKTKYSGSFAAWTALKHAVSFAIAQPISRAVRDQTWAGTENPENCNGCAMAVE